MNIKELLEIEQFLEQVRQETEIYRSPKRDTSKLDQVLRALGDSISSNKAYEKSRELMRRDLALETSHEAKLLGYIDLFKLGYQISMLDGKIFMLQRDLLEKHLEHLLDFKNN